MIIAAIIIFGITEAMSIYDSKRSLSRKTVSIADNLGMVSCMIAIATSPITMAILAHAAMTGGDFTSLAGAIVIGMQLLLLEVVTCAYTIVSE